MEFGGVDFGRGDRQPGLSLSLSLSLCVSLRCSLVVFAPVRATAVLGAYLPSGQSQESQGPTWRTVSRLFTFGIRGMRMWMQVWREERRGLGALPDGIIHR